MARSVADGSVATGVLGVCAARRTGRIDRSRIGANGHALPSSAPYLCLRSEGSWLATRRRCPRALPPILSDGALQRHGRRAGWSPPTGVFDSRPHHHPRGCAPRDLRSRRWRGLTPIRGPRGGWRVCFARITLVGLFQRSTGLRRWARTCFWKPPPRARRSQIRSGENRAGHALREGYHRGKASVGLPLREIHRTDRRRSAATSSTPMLQSTGRVPDARATTAWDLR